MILQMEAVVSAGHSYLHSATWRQTDHGEHSMTARELDLVSQVMKSAKVKFNN